MATAYQTLAKKISNTPYFTDFIAYHNEDLSNGEKFYKVLTPISQGSDGDVFVGSSADGRRVCLKVVKLRSESSKKHVLQELTMGFKVLLSSCPSTIVSLYDWVWSGPLNRPAEIALVMELCDFSLQNMISVVQSFSSQPSSSRSRFSISSSEIARVFVDILNALIYIHSLNCLHGDVKTENILFKSRNWKICDFGSSYCVPEIKLRKMSGTLWTAAPEVIRIGLLSVRSDVWSFGVVLWEAIHLEKPFNSWDLHSYQNGSDSTFSLEPRQRKKKLSPFTVRLVYFILEKMMVSDMSERSSTNEIKADEICDLAEREKLCFKNGRDDGFSAENISRYLGCTPSRSSNNATLSLTNTDNQS